MEWIEGLPGVDVAQKEKLYRYVHKNNATQTSHALYLSAMLNWKQTHYMVIEEPSAKSSHCLPDAAKYALELFKESAEKTRSQSEDLKPFKKAWDEAGEEAKRRTLTPDDRIDAIVEALDNHLRESEKTTDARIDVMNERMNTQAQALEKVMDIVNVLIKKVIAMEGKL